MDVLTPEQRSRNMAAIKSRNTKPEVIVRQILHALGFRFRLHRKDLPGRPDIVLPKYRTIVLVHGCFWHQHSGCKLASNPSSRKDYWRPKLNRNVERDKQNMELLRQSGWHVIIVWECELKDINQVKQRLIGEIRKVPIHQPLPKQGTKGSYC